MSVPVVDFGKFLHGSASERKLVATEIDSAFRSTGFVFLKNHSVDQTKVQQCFDWVCFISMV